MRVPPHNARIVIVSTGTDPWNDAVADDLARQLQARGWWVDRPDLERAHGTGRSGQLRPAASGGVGSLVDRAVDTVVARMAARLALRIGDSPHAVVGVHPLVDRVLGLLRRSGALTAPVATYLGGPDVRSSWGAGGADVILSPHPAVDRLLSRLPGPPAVLPIKVTAVAGTPTDRGRPAAGRARVVVPAWASSGRRTAAVVRDLASWGVRPLVLCGTNHVAARWVDALGAGTARTGGTDAAAILGEADFVVDPTAGAAGWLAVLQGRQVISYRVPRSAEGMAADLHAAGAAVWARSRIDLGLALTGHVGPALAAATTQRLDPVSAIEAVAVDRSSAA